MTAGENGDEDPVEQVPLTDDDLLDLAPGSVESGGDLVETGASL